MKDVGMGLLNRICWKELVNGRYGNDDNGEWDSGNVISECNMWKWGW